MNRYFYFWRLGSVAFIVLFLCGVGINLVGRGALLLVAGTTDLGVYGSDDFMRRLAIAGAAFLIVGLPYAGWVFDIGVRKVNQFVQGSAKRQSLKEQ